MSLDSFPKELLLMTTEYLPLRDLEALALTFNKSITLACLPELEPLFARRRHEARMTALFGACSAPVNSRSGLKDYLEDLGIPADAELKNIKSGQVDLSYLDLKGDLHWLGPLDRGTERAMAPHMETHSSTGLPLLQKQAEKASITLPSALVKVLESKELMDRIPDRGASHFQLIGSLRKCPAKLHGGLGGFAVCFYTDQQDWPYWLLYLIPSPPGQVSPHCVLRSTTTGIPYESEDVDSEYDKALWTKEERDGAMKEEWDMSVLCTDDVRLDGYDFEEWLAQHYFDEWLGFVLYEKVKWDDPNIERLREYVREVYVKR
ncbi:hypothetical protein SLS60_005060 [Paraconiothyrium brasiliense]|uniref:F-box domain-containing protein n=1 Tax=Paraconiothyrium brasiliense TaxID=300254 RepID=A0ABR3RGA6_9PLEO